MSTTEGPTYTDLARQVQELEADNAALLAVLRDTIAMIDSTNNEPTCVLVAPAIRAFMAQPHPGSALLDKMEALKEQVARCQERERKHAALMGVPDGGRYANDWEMHAEVIRKQADDLDRLKAGQRSVSEARQQAFLDLAQELADMTPEQMAVHVKRVLERYDGGGQ
jgi:hypothetical protein